MKRIISLLITLCLCLGLGTMAFADNDGFLDLTDGEVYEVTETMFLSRLTIDETSSLTAPEGYTAYVTVGGYLKHIEAGTAYEFYGDVVIHCVEDAIVGESLRGASAAYVENAEVSYSDQLFLSYGFMDGEYIDANGDGEFTEDEWVSDSAEEYTSEFGMAAGVLVTGEDAVAYLDNITVLTSDTSSSNGVFAANGATVYINDSTIVTNNGNGHGLDATFGGTFYVDNCVIFTNGFASGTFSTDFGGGFFKITNCHTEATIARDSENPGPQGLYAAGSSIFILENTTMITDSTETIMCAHNNSVVVLKDCYLYGPEVIDGHQAMPSPENAVGDTTYIFDSTLEAFDAAILHECGGVTTHNLVNCDTSLSTSDYATMVEYEDGMGTGKIYVNLWDTEMTGDIYCDEGGVVEVNLYDGAVFTGEVITGGECEVTINVYNGGEYIGEYEANYIDETVETPVYTEDTYGSIEWLGCRV